MTDELQGVALTLHTIPGEDEPPKLRVIGFEGEEAISCPYRFEIDLESDNPNIDVASLLHRRVTLSLHFEQSRNVHGLVSEAVQLDQPWPGRFAYRVVLVPTLARLGLSSQSQIYGTSGPLSILDIVEIELTGRNAEGTRETAAARVDARNLEIRVPRDACRPRDYVVQFQETDLAFISRLMEQRGIFYYFQHPEGSHASKGQSSDGDAEDRERLIIGDHNAAFSPLPEYAGAIEAGHRQPKVLEFAPPSTGRSQGRTTVHSIERRCVQLPAKVVLREHNYRGEPGSKRNPQYLHAELPVDEDGHGVQVGYDDHFRTRDEGRELATVRVEELRCQQDVYHGISDCYVMNAGYRFELSGHFSSTFNQAMLLRKVVHRGGSRLPKDGPQYLNEFEAIPAQTPFRPERRTPRPYVPGIFNAFVDSAGAGTRARIDSSGRYKIRVPFDLTEAEAGMGSRYMRMAQPYANYSAAGGGSAGMHFPLLKGTEVVCACVNGNPDRPVILAAIPNPRTKSPITSQNANKNRIRTTSGILMEFDDGAASSD